MAKLAIKGHATLGKEVIETLEMLGGINKFNLDGAETNRYYYIEDSKIHLSLSIYPYDYTIYTIEEFLEKFPYKVGDKVQHNGATSLGSVYVIEQMKWEDNQVKYVICDLYLENNKCTVISKDLQPYKEEAMKKEISGAIVDRFICLEGYDFYDDKGNIIDTKEITMKKQQKYPTTYEECFNICFGNKHHIVQVVGLDDLGDNKELFESFIKLKICRDAYWKIAGDWKEKRKEKTIHHVLYSTPLGEVVKATIPNCIGNYQLDFPTEEMRDMFYENFKELIENCKELL